MELYCKTKKNERVTGEGKSYGDVSRHPEGVVLRLVLRDETRVGVVLVEIRVVQHDLCNGRGRVEGEERGERRTLDELPFVGVVGVDGISAHFRAEVDHAGQVARRVRRLEPVDERTDLLFLRRYNDESPERNEREGGRGRKSLRVSRQRGVGLDGGVVAAEGKDSPEIRTGSRRFQAGAEIVRIEIGQIDVHVRHVRDDLKEKREGGGARRERERGGVTLESHWRRELVDCKPMKRERTGP